MPNLYEQTVLDLQVDPVAEVAYADACKMAWHYAELANRTLDKIHRLGTSKEGLFQDLERRRSKCAESLSQAYELGLKLGLTG